MLDVMVIGNLKLKRIKPFRVFIVLLEKQINERLQRLRAFVQCGTQKIDFFLLLRIFIRQQPPDYRYRNSQSPQV